MKLTDEAKRDILNFVLERVANVANKEYQKRVWIRGDGPEEDSFDDAVCDFFMECESILERNKDFSLDNLQYQLKIFHDEFENFPMRHDWPGDFIDTPEWEKIIDLAKEVLEGFQYQKKQS